MENRRVIVGPKEMLATRTVPVREINWLGDAPLATAPEWHVSVKVRSTRPPREAVIRPLSETEAEVELLTPEEGVSPGQACVFYETGGSAHPWRRLDLEGLSRGGLPRTGILK